MSHHPIGRNAKCRCGSGKQYKQCCMKKDFDEPQHESETLPRSIPMSDEISELLKSHRDPEIEDPCIGHCVDCGQHWCCDCEQLLQAAKAASSHDCPAWEAMENEFEGI